MSLFFSFLDPLEAVNFGLVPGNNIKLHCQVHSNLAEVLWRFFDQTLHSNNKYYMYSGGLLIMSASEADAGLYTCYSVERISGRTISQTLAVYQLELNPGILGSTTPGNEVLNSSDPIQGQNTTVPGMVPLPSAQDPLSSENQSDTDRVTGLEVAVALLSLLCLSLTGFIIWNWTQGRMGCFKLVQRPSESEGTRQSAEYMHIPNRTSEKKLPHLESRRPFHVNNNHNAVDFRRKEEHLFTPTANISTLNGLGYIDDESEI